MSVKDIDTPFSIEIDEAKLQALADGEKMKVPLESDGPMDDRLVVTWETGQIESEGAEELHEELTSLF